MVYLTADEEDNFIVAQANEPLDEEGRYIHNNVSGRFRTETSEFRKITIDLMDVSPKMVFSVATAMIPFLQNDDANRALMGSNAGASSAAVSLKAPVVGNRYWYKAAVTPALCCYAKKFYALSVPLPMRSSSREIPMETVMYII